MVNSMALVLCEFQARSPLDELSRRVRVLGIGEATRGSRKFGDVRLAITQRLVERFGDHAHFTRSFNRDCGMSPSRFRSLIPAH